MLHVNDLVFRIGGRTLFDGATVAVPEGHKAGLVGRNGAGKTTFFRIVAGELPVDGGSVRVRRGARIGTVAQEAPGGPASLLDTVLAADTERAALLDAAESETDGHRLAEVHTRIADIDAHAAPARAAAILAGLGFDTEAQARPCSSFSGGWRMRVALAAALFARPDLLLLDEPTNHLDLEAALWLEGYLTSWRGTLLVISHDRDLLNRVVGEIIHLEDGRLTRYAGGYDRFERTRRERQATQGRLRDRQIAERKRIQAFVDRFRAKATKARQAQSRIKLLERMEPVATVIEEATPSFAFPAPDPLPPPLVVLDHARAGYDPERPVLKDVNLRIDMDDRIALIGANGNGKSTLAKVLAGRLKLQDGVITRARALRIGYFAQHQADELDLAASPYDHVARARDDWAPARVRAHLGGFGFGADKADNRVATLSGGEKARLLFALMSLDAPHLLMLDEPVNHLDIDAREALAQALNTYDGAVVLVSHDVHLVDAVCDRLWLVADGDCTPFDGDLGDYRTLLLDVRRATKRADRAPNGGERKQARRDRAAARAETAALRTAARDAERRLDALHADKHEIETALADPAQYAGDPARMTELQRRLAEVGRALEETENAWLSAHEALEDAE